MHSVLVLAAGQGTRLMPYTREVPKPLLTISDKPILQWILEGLAHAGFREFFLVVGFRGEQIRDYFGDGSRWDVSIQYIDQPVQEGTGAAVNLVRDHPAFHGGPFICTYGDILCSYGVYGAFRDLLRGGANSALAVNYVPDPWAGAAVYFGEDDIVTEIVEKPPKGTATTTWNNAGVYMLPPEVFAWLARTPLSSRGELELTQAIERGIQAGARFHVVQIPRDSGFWCDVGTPQVLERLRTRSEWVARLKS